MARLLVVSDSDMSVFVELIFHEADDCFYTGDCNAPRCEWDISQGCRPNRPLDDVAAAAEEHLDRRH